MIRLSDRGDLVRAWQRIVGVPARQCDGVFGPSTSLYILRWKKANGLDTSYDTIDDECRTKVDAGGLIKAYEGLRLVAYDDHDGTPLQWAAGVWRRVNDGAACLGFPTIGWGKRLLPGEVIPTCTRDQADAWFAKALNETFMPVVRRYAPVGVNAAQIAAMASYAYNAGAAEKVQGGLPGPVPKLAAAAFAPEWWSTHYTSTKGVLSAGLQLRRLEEACLFADVLSIP